MLPVATIEMPPSRATIVSPLASPAVETSESASIAGIAVSPALPVATAPVAAMVSVAALMSTPPGALTRPSIWTSDAALPPSTSWSAGVSLALPAGVPRTISRPVLIVPVAPMISPLGTTKNRLPPVLPAALPIALVTVPLIAAASRTMLTRLLALAGTTSVALCAAATLK